jgi:uncharacterized protein YoxC
MSEVWIPLAVGLLALGVVLLAVLVGAAIPVLSQLRSTLVTARRTLERLGPETDRTLTEARKAASRIERLCGQFEQGGEGLVKLMHELGGVGAALGKLRHSMHTAAAVGGALGPAVVAALGALGRGGREDTEAEPPAQAEEETGPAAERIHRRFEEEAEEQQEELIR